MTIGGAADALAAARTWEELLRSETLALDVHYGDAAGGFSCKVGDNSEVIVKVERVS